MPACAGWKTPALLNDEVFYLYDRSDCLLREDELEMFLEYASLLKNQAHNGSTVQQPIVDDVAHNVPANELSLYSGAVFVSSGTHQANSFTEGSDTPSSTPAQTCTESGSPVATSDDLASETSPYFVERAAHQDPHVVGHLFPPSQLNLCQPTNPGGSPSAPLQHGHMSVQMRLPFATHGAPGVTSVSGTWLGNTPGMAHRHYGAGASSSGHDRLAVGQLRSQFHGMAPFCQDGESMANAGSTGPYHYSPSYSPQWSEPCMTLQSPTDSTHHNFQHGSASIGTQFDSKMDIDEPGTRDVTGLHNPGVVDTPSPYSNVEAPRLRSNSFLPDAGYEYCVPPQSAPFQATTYRSDNIMAPSCDHATSQVARPTARLGAPAGVMRRRTRRDAAEPNAVTARTARGGRTRELSPATRERANQMRIHGACWPCKILKESCDYEEGAPCCSRCQRRGYQLTMQLFGTCDRTKLPEFIKDFLPESVSYMHQIHTVTKEIQQNVNKDFDRFFDQDINVSLSIGFGPPLNWKLREFKASDQAFLKQSQYVHNSESGESMLNEKWSPPLRVERFDSIDIGNFERYLDQLLEPDVLKRLGVNFYKAESKMDREPEKFQATLLQLMCDLYIDSRDDQLRQLLKKILRMLLVTYIMAHVLTIQRSTMEGVMRSMQHAALPKNLQAIKHISPRLANQQFKCHFSRIRAALYGELLTKFQSILSRNSESMKEATWTHSFCLMLGFAMMLEEIQHTLYIQAHSSIVKGDKPRTQAIQQCSGSCQRIDERFALLTGVHQSKYRSKKKFTGSGSFGPGTPNLKDDASRTFAYKVRRLAKSRLLDLEDRANVKPLPENHHLYTTRLTARFLLSFRDQLYA